MTAALWCLLAATSCGYAPLYNAEPANRLHVRLFQSLVPDSVASDDVVAGVREELAAEGMLEAGDGFPRAEVEVLRSDEASEAITATGGAPVARATDLGLTGRAWVVRSRAGGREEDTGDIRAQETVAVDESGGVRDPRAALFHAEDGLRAAARRLGHKLARRLLGLPAASEENEATWK